MKSTLRWLGLAVIIVLFPINLALAADDFCWKDSYGRGVGTIPTGCKGGKENQSGLCYEKCPANASNGVGPVCWSGCPAGYTDMGAVCHINLPLTKNPNWVCTHWWPGWMGGGCRWKDTRCPSGYTNAGLFCALTARPTPAGFSGTYLDPMKNTHPRGAGTIPNDCGSGKDYDAGLCYSGCRAGYGGVGPVCWGKPPTAWVNCGMGNARDSGTCASVVVDQVSSVGQIALTIATAGMGSEEAAGAKAGEKAAAKGATEAEQAAAKAKAVADAKKLADQVEKLKKVVDAAAACSQALISVTQMKNADDQNAAITALTLNGAKCATSAVGFKFPKAGDKAGKAVDTINAFNTYATAMKNQQAAMAKTVPAGAQIEKMTPEDTARLAAQIASLADPTGVSSAVAAYTYPKCSAIFR